MKISVNCKNGSKFRTSNPKTIERWKKNKGALVTIKESSSCPDCGAEVFDLKQHQRTTKKH